VLADDRSNSIVVSGTVDDVRLIRECRQDRRASRQVSIQVSLPRSRSLIAIHGVNQRVYLTTGRIPKGAHRSVFTPDTELCPTSRMEYHGGIVNPLSFRSRPCNNGSNSNVKVLSADTIVHDSQQAGGIRRQPAAANHPARPRARGPPSRATVIEFNGHLQRHRHRCEGHALIGDDGRVQLAIRPEVRRQGWRSSGRYEHPAHHRSPRSHFVHQCWRRPDDRAGRPWQADQAFSSRRNSGFLRDPHPSAAFRGGPTKKIRPSSALRQTRIYPANETSTDANTSIITDDKNEVRYLDDPSIGPKESRSSTDSMMSLWSVRHGCAGQESLVALANG